MSTHNVVKGKRTKTFPVEYGSYVGSSNNFLAEWILPINTFLQKNVRHPVTTKSRPVSEFGRVATKIRGNVAA